jgi:hypothetical protein
MNEDLAKILSTSLEDITAACPTEVRSKKKKKKKKVSECFLYNIVSSEVFL